MPSDFLANAKPVKPEDDFLSNAQPVAQAQGEMSAGQPESWLNQLEGDLTYGGNRTLPGRILGYMQGRGGKGYSGMGEGPMGVKSSLASIFMGPVHTAEGIQEMGSHPGHGTLDALKGLLETSQMPLMFAGGPEADAAMEAIPSKSHAVDMLNTIQNEARNVPVYMDRTSPAFDRFGEHVAAGGKNAKVMSLLKKRIGASGVFARTPPVAPRVAGFFRPPDIPLGEAPVPGEMPGALVDAERFPAQNVGEARIVRNAKGQMLSRTARKIEYPDESGKLPPARGYNGRMLTQKPTGKAWMAGTGEPMFPEAEQISGPGVFRPANAMGKFPVDEFGRVDFRANPFHTAAPPEGDPIYFPEARRFYTNVSDVTRKPGVFARALESSRNPRLRAAAGGVREALHSDLSNAADTIGRGNDYRDAIKEYAQAAKMRKYLRAGAKVGGGVLLSRTPLGKKIAREVTR